MDLLDALSSGLGVIGDVLDAPGRAVRGLISGREGASGQELLQSLGMDPGEGLGGTLAGIGTEIITDPLTFAGGFLGRAIGKGASAAAAARGPRYPTSGDDFLAMLGKSDGADFFSGATSADELARVASEVPPGSSFLGAGTEGVALQTPKGGVIRIGPELSDKPGRPLSDAVLQATRAVNVPFSDSADWINRVEHLPFADRVNDAKFWQKRDPSTMKTPIDDLRRSAAHTGLDFTDRHYGNVGVVGGKPKIIDPGAFRAVDGYYAGYAPVLNASEPGLLMRALLNMGGADEATRAAIESGLSGPNLAGRFTRAGAGTGASAGAFSRS